MLYDDGDGVPVFIVHDGTSWTITDDGMTVSHLYFDDFEATEARVSRLRAAAATDGAEVTPEHAVTLRLSDRPTAFDVGDFLQIVSGLRSLAVASSTEREQTRFVTTVRERVTPHLADPGWEPNWLLPGTGSSKSKYRVDLKVPTDRPDEPVALFIASTGEKTNLAALTVVHLQRASSRARPVLAYNPDRVTSEAIVRFQDEVEDDSAAIPVPAGQVDQLVPALQRRGVAVA
jgi:hypothetical protein